SGIFLTRQVPRPNPEAHRFDHWRMLAQSLGLDLKPNDKLITPASGPNREEILIHSGAGQPVRVWPLARYLELTTRLRGHGYKVQVACDPDQQGWWRSAGE